MALRGVLAVPAPRDLRRKRPFRERRPVSRIGSVVGLDFGRSQVPVPHPLLQRAHRHAGRGHQRPERVAQRVEGDPALAPAALPHPGGRHRRVEALARLAADRNRWGGSIRCGGERDLLAAVAVWDREREVHGRLEMRCGGRQESCKGGQEGHLRRISSLLRLEDRQGAPCQRGMGHLSPTRGVAGGAPVITPHYCFRASAGALAQFRLACARDEWGPLERPARSRLLPQERGDRREPMIGFMCLRASGWHLRVVSLL